MRTVRLTCCSGCHPTLTVAILIELFASTLLIICAHTQLSGSGCRLCYLRWYRVIRMQQLNLHRKIMRNPPVETLFAGPLTGKASKLATSRTPARFSYVRKGKLSRLQRLSVKVARHICNMGLPLPRCSDNALNTLASLAVPPEGV